MHNLTLLAAYSVNVSQQQMQTDSAGFLHMPEWQYCDSGSVWLNKYVEPRPSSRCNFSNWLHITTHPHVGMGMLCRTNFGAQGQSYISAVRSAMDQLNVHKDTRMLPVCTQTYMIEFQVHTLTMRQPQPAAQLIVYKLCHPASRSQYRIIQTLCENQAAQLLIHRSTRQEVRYKTQAC